MKLKQMCFVVLMMLVGSSIAADERQQQSRWLVTLEHLKPLSTEERQFVMNMLGIEIDMDTLEQAIQEAEVPIEAFGGE